MVTPAGPIARPVYETQQNKVAERLLLDRFCLEWHAAAEELPPKYEFDFLLRSGPFATWLELKCRNVAHDKFDTYMIGLSKVAAAQRLAKASMYPAHLGVQWTDRIGWVRLDTAPVVRGYYVEMGGRLDRGDGQDIEPVAHIPISYFKFLGEE